MGDGRLDPAAPIPGSAEGQTVGDFWAWAYSNVLTNTTRGLFAEFLVGTALGAVGGTRTEWDAFDLLYAGAGPEGDAKKIEVKASSYLQSWEQKEPSAISFGVGERYAIDPETDDRTTERARPSDCYVFCVYTEKVDKDPAKVLDTDRWEFYVVPTPVIDEELGGQKTVSLGRVRGLADPVAYSGLGERVEEALARG